MSLLTTLLAAALCVSTGELPPTATNLSGARALGMGDSFRAASGSSGEIGEGGGGNESIYMNPAGLAAYSRFQWEAQGGYDFGLPGGQCGLSVVDSTTTPVAAGLAYNRFISGPPGSRTIASLFHLALAMPLSDNVSIGITGKWLHDTEVSKHNAITPDAGLLLHLDPVAFAFVAYNMVDVGSPEAPRQFAAAVMLGTDSVLRGALDVVADTATRSYTSFAFHVGGELAPTSYLAVRLGYIEDRILMAHVVSAGVGFFLPLGFGVDLAYRQEIGGVLDSKELALGLKLQMRDYGQ